jgi:hypothetical protein
MTPGQFLDSLSYEDYLLITDVYSMLPTPLERIEVLLASVNHAVNCIISGLGSGQAPKIEDSSIPDRVKLWRKTYLKLQEQRDKRKKRDRESQEIFERMACYMVAHNGLMGAT